MRRRVWLSVVSAGCGLCIYGQATGQVLLSGTSYSEDFDALGGGLPPGWSVWAGATDVGLGTETSFGTNATSWGATAGGFRNCASITNNAGDLATNANSTMQHGFTNRVLAVRQGSGFGDPGAAFVLQIGNTIGFSNLRFSVDFLMLDDEDRETAWTVDYGFGVTPASFTRLGTYTNSGPPGTVVRPTYALGADANHQSEVLTLRVAALDGSTGGGSRDTFGLDNVRLTFNGVAVLSIPLAIQPAGDSVVLSWSDPSFSLQGATDVTGTFTNVPGATSPHTNALNGDQLFFRLVK